MAISDGTILRVVASLLFPDSVIAQNVFHLVATDLSGGNDEDDVVADMEEYIDDIYANLVSQMADTITAGEIKVYEYDSVDDDFDEVGTGAGSFAPSAADQMLPHGCALVQNFYTIDPDVQGRKFWGGIHEGGQNAGNFSSTPMNAAIAAAADVIATFVSTALSNQYTPVVWSPTGKVAKTYSGTVGTNAIVGYQRRRKAGVGI